MKVEEINKAYECCKDSFHRHCDDCPVTDDCCHDKMPLFVLKYALELLEDEEELGEELGNAVELIRKKDERIKELLKYKDELEGDLAYAVDSIRKLKPRLLTYEEMKVRGQNCDAVYIEQSPENSYRKCFWGLACPGVEPPKDEPFNYPGGVDFNVVDVEGDMQDGDFYQLNTPLGWRAWSGKPTEEQMKAVSWSIT